MRSITCTSILALAALPALAAEGPEGCFARVYDKAHLARHPAQVVRDISVAFGDFGEDVAKWADVQVTTADQGRAGRDGLGNATFAQIARCTGSTAPGGWTCHVECDGGSFEIMRLDDAALVLRTRYFILGQTDDCGGNVDLAEVADQEVTYRLDRQPDAACAGRW